MSRRKGRCFRLSHLAADARPDLLAEMPNSARLLARHPRARTPAALDALTDPRRRMPRVACGQRPGKVGAGKPHRK